jgi:hypothetical protein
MPSFALLVTIVLSIAIFMLIAYGLVIYGLRDIFFAGQDIGSRLATYVAMPEESNPAQAGQRRRVGLVRMRLRLNNMLSGLASEQLSLQLMSANWPITETEYVLIRIASVILAFLLGSLIVGSVLSGIGLAVVVFFNQYQFAGRWKHRHHVGSGHRNHP